MGNPSWTRAEYTDSSHNRVTFFRSLDRNILVQIMHADSSWFLTRVGRAKPILLAADGTVADEDFVDDIEPDGLEYCSRALRVQAGAEEAIGAWRIVAGRNDSVVLLDTTHGHCHVLSNGCVIHHTGKTLPARQTE